MKSLFIILSLLLGTQLSFASADKEAAALAAANTWIEIIDSGKYKESYKETATFFKSKVTESQWETAVSNVRKPLGKLISRKVKSKQYTTHLPGVPDGEYVVILFDTVYENKKEASEVITPMLDNDKKWHVSGYFVK